MTYEEMAVELRVSVKTIRNWKSQGVFKIIGYKRLGKWRKIAIVSMDEVIRLIHKKYGDAFE